MKLLAEKNWELTWFKRLNHIKRMVVKKHADGEFQTATQLPFETPIQAIQPRRLESHGAIVRYGRYFEDHLIW